MSRFKRLIVEIHHRSLWQVLLIYLAASWIVFEVVQTVTEGLGLPPWFPAFAASLLLVGLPLAANRDRFEIDSDPGREGATREATDR